MLTGKKTQIRASDRRLFKRPLRTTSLAIAVVTALLFGVVPAIPAAADELDVYASSAIATLLGSVGDRFERSSGYKLIVTTGTGAGLTGRIKSGQSFDVVIVPSSDVDRLVKDGTLVAGTRTTIARSGIGIEVRAGARRPDISSVETFKRALLGATSIAFLNQAASGVYVAGMLDRLGIAGAIQSKVVRPDTDIVSQLVADGKVELGIVAITQILTTPGVQLVGPLPADLQSYVTFDGAVSSNAHAAEEAAALLRFLIGPVAVPVIKAQGMEPNGDR